MHHLLRYPTSRTIRAEPPVRHGGAPPSQQGITMSKFVVILASSQRGDLYRRPAPSRLEAFELAIEVIDDAIACEKQHAWCRGETVMIKVEENVGGRSM